MPRSPAALPCPPLEPPSRRRPLRACRLAMLAFAGLFLAASPGSAQVPTLEARVPGVLLDTGDLSLEVTVGEVPAGRTLAVQVFADDKLLGTRHLEAGSHTLEFEDVLSEELSGGGPHRVMVQSGTLRQTLEVSPIPGWLSLVPPLLAIGLALLFKDVLVSLFLGVFSGALILVGGNPLPAFARSIDTFVAPALADLDHAKILIFSALLGGMVGIISKSGGTRGIVESISRFASNARRGQVATWLMGLAVFFDDYANTLIVGSTMRPITDRLRISREKLAYLVDSTAAPVASLVPISTWIGFEVGLIATAFSDLGISGDYNPYAAFVASIPYRFYPILALVLGLTVALSGRDLGPMLTAERRARKTGELLRAGDTALADYGAEALEPPPGTPHRAVNAVLPILTVIGVTLAGLYTTGAAAVAGTPYPSTWVYLREVFAASDPYNTLLWASLAGVVVALLLPLGQRILELQDGMGAMIEGFKSMLLALVVLILAWAVSGVCTELHTADYLVGLTEGNLSPHLLPVLVFLISAATAFATGSSWGTMGILVPLVIPVAHGLSLAAGHPVGSDLYGVLLLGAISSVLAGSVWGDHCSPISDTTILSSMASGCDHIAHVRTQLPYALSIGILGMLLGDIPTAYGLSPWISLLVGTAVVVGGVLWLGKRVEGEPASGLNR